MKRVMIVYDGTYRLPAEPEQSFKPRTRWECAWQVRIINLDLSRPTVKHLKPMIVVVNQTGTRPCLSSCAESIGKKISRDFSLEVSRVLWLEKFPNNPKQWYTATFMPQSGSGPNINYHIRWRPSRPKEIDIIEPFITEVGTVS